jgi:NTE family protein
MKTSAKIKHVGLALQGGGSHGAFTWGVLDRLMEEETLSIDAICGTSAGAVNAVVCAYGFHKGGAIKAKELLANLWRKVSMAGGFKPSAFDKYFGHGDLTYSPEYVLYNALAPYLSPYTFNPFNYNPLRTILDELVDFKDLHTYEDKKIFICATNVKTNRARIFPIKEITADTVLASACLPLLFQAVKVDDAYYWDGGYMGNPPIFPIINRTSVKDIVLVKLDSFNIKSVPSTVREISDRVNEISFNSSLINEIKIIQYRNELLRHGILKTDDTFNREIFMHTISGYETFSQMHYSSKMNTSWEFLTGLKQKGRETAERWLRKEFTSVGSSSTFSVEEHLSGTEC